MLDDLDRILPGWQPDLLIHESTEMAGAIAAGAGESPTSSIRSGCSDRPN